MKSSREYCERQEHLVDVSNSDPRDHLAIVNAHSEWLTDQSNATVKAAYQEHKTEVSDGHETVVERHEIPLGSQNSKQSQGPSRKTPRLSLHTTDEL